MTTDFFKPLRRRPRKPGGMSPRRSALGIAAALIVALGGAAVFVGSPASAATMTAATAHATTAHATSAVTPAETADHVCEVIGHDSTNQAVVCADLVVTSLGDGAYAVNGQAEAICQGLSNKSSYPQCANAEVWIAIEDANNGDAVLRACGHANGPCSTPRTFFSSPVWDVADGQCLQDVYATIYYYLPSTNTTIELPGSGTEEFMNANLSTAAFNVGSGC